MFENGSKSHIPTDYFFVMQKLLVYTFFLITLKYILFIFEIGRCVAVLICCKTNPPRLEVFREEIVQTIT